MGRKPKSDTLGAIPSGDAEWEGSARKQYDFEDAAKLDFEDPRDAFFLLKYMQTADIDAACAALEYPLGLAQQLLKVPAAINFMRHQRIKRMARLNMDREEIVYRLKVMGHQAMAQCKRNTESKNADLAAAHRDREFARKCLLDIAMLQGYASQGDKPATPPPASSEMNVNTYVHFGPATTLEPPLLAQDQEALPEARAIPGHDDVPGGVLEGVYRGVESEEPEPAEALLAGT